MSAAAESGLVAQVSVRWGDTVIATKRLTEGTQAIVGASLGTIAARPTRGISTPSRGLAP